MPRPLLLFLLLLTASAPAAAADAVEGSADVYRLGRSSIGVSETPQAGKLVVGGYVGYATGEAADGAVRLGYGATPNLSRPGLSLSWTQPLLPGLSFDSYAGTAGAEADGQTGYVVGTGLGLRF